MTDYTLLIAKLNHYISHNDNDFVKTFIACADALEALAKQSAKASQEAEQQARQIAELEIIAQYAGEDNARAEQYAARIAELEAVLEPFAKYADIYEAQVDFERDDGAPCIVSMGQLRAARAALEKKDD